MNNLFRSLLILNTLLFWPQEGKTEEKAPYWNLPVVLDGGKSEVGFTLDTTWHLVHAKAPKYTGKVWLENPADFQSIRAEISISAADMDSDNSLRDSKMREVMAAEEFPFISFQLLSVQGLPSPEMLQKKQSIRLIGTLRIRNVKKKVEIKGLLSRKKDEFEVSGEFPVFWGKFNVEDPSILIAKVAPKADVQFRIVLPKQQ